MNRSVLQSAQLIAAYRIRLTLKRQNNSKRKLPTSIRLIPIGADSNA